VVGKDGKFRTNLVYVLADLMKNEKVASIVSKETGIQLDKNELKGMVGMVIDDQYQKIEMTVSGSTREVVKAVVDKLPNIVVNSANQLYYVDNLHILGNDGAIFESGKNYKRNVAAGAVGGLGIGFLAIFIFLIFDDRLRDRKGISRLFSLEYLGRTNCNSKGEQCSNDDISLLSTRILLKSKCSSSNIFANLWVNHEESYESVYNIASCIGNLGKKVLIVDAHKSSSISKRINCQNKQGFSDIVSGEKYDVSKIICEVKEGVHVIQYGSYEDIGLGHIIDGTLKPFISEIKSKYDLVFVNIPYSMGIDKALSLSYLCDSTVLAVGEEKARIKNIEEIISNLKDTGIGITGYYTVV
jgi:capsular polysaccharide biosynthesis protein